MTLRKISTSLVRCDPMRDEKACGLLQMEYTIPPEVLYSAYWYRSGTNNAMRRDLQGIVEEVMGMTGLKESALVLDIGCNDGTLLGFYPDSFTKFGVDPSDVAQEIKAPVNIIQDIFPSEELISRLDSRTFDIITSIAMYYDLEDPIAFTRGIDIKPFWLNLIKPCLWAGKQWLGFQRGAATLWSRAGLKPRPRAYYKHAR